MSNQESKLLDYVDAGTAYWQYRYKPAEYEREQQQEQTNKNTDDTWIILLGILGTIGFVILLVLKTF